MTDAERLARLERDIATNTKALAALIDALAANEADRKAILKRSQEISRQIQELNDRLARLMAEAATPAVAAE